MVRQRQEDPKYVNHESESEAGLFVSFKELLPIPTTPRGVNGHLCVERLNLAKSRFAGSLW